VKKFIADFTSWAQVFESRSQEEVTQRIEDIKQLVDLGMVKPDELTAFLKKEGVSAMIEHMPEIKRITDSLEYREILERGLVLVSSPTQLLNGTIVFGYPGYRLRDQFAIGLFPGTKTIKRMTPKGIPMGVEGRSPYGIGSLDFRIKQLENVPDDQFYRVAMRWILDHIDFEQIDRRSGTPFFPVKNRTRAGYFERS